MPRSRSDVGDPRQNKLLAALPDGEWQRLQPSLAPIYMRRKALASRPAQVG